MQVNVKPFSIASLPIVGWSVPTKVFAKPEATRGKSLVVMVGVFDWGVAQQWSAPLTDLRGRVYVGGQLLYHTHRWGEGGNPVVINPMYYGDEYPNHIRERIAGMPQSMSLRRLNYAVDELLSKALIAATKNATIPSVS